MQEQLDKCKEAMRMFPYFNTWSDASVMECCALSKIERYEMDQTILGNSLPLELKGVNNFNVFKKKLKKYLLCKVFYSLQEFF
jgi:hypothetical protein